MIIFLSNLASNTFVVNQNPKISISIPYTTKNQKKSKGLIVLVLSDNPIGKAPPIPIGTQHI